MTLMMRNYANPISSDRYRVGRATSWRSNYWYSANRMYQKSPYHTVVISFSSVNAENKWSTVSQWRMS